MSFQHRLVKQFYGQCFFCFHEYDDCNYFCFVFFVTKHKVMKCYYEKKMITLTLSRF